MENEIPPSRGSPHPSCVIEGAEKQQQMLDIIDIHDWITSLEVIISSRAFSSEMMAEVQALGDLAHEGGCIRLVCAPLPQFFKLLPLCPLGHGDIEKAHVIWSHHFPKIAFPKVFSA